ncbi:hypothetical protein [Actinosynnema sp. ALI-1.44]|uniref:hypothetical protein n=1 Tax=Actinosynnema sp. ALI-1.44 TaxID=1933779 RepID=UPI001ED9FDF4|nr:hypothetical protein [Actinosynnema sp. ALI-1.44]
MKKQPWIWVLRGAGVLFLLTVLGQALLAGLFVTGDIGFLAMHEVNGSIVGLAAMVWVAAALVLRAPRRMVLVGLGAFLATGAQIGLGHARGLQLHIPLGVLLFGAAVALTTMSFAYRAELT